MNNTITWINLALAGISVYIAWLTYTSQAKASPSSPSTSGSTGPEDYPDVDDVRALYKQYASSFSTAEPETLMSMWRWETGNGTSNLWINYRNPGGLKYSTNPNLGHSWGSVKITTKSEGTVYYAVFPNATEAVKAHVKFLNQDRYSAARDQDPFAQVGIIANAGYAEDPSWRAGVISVLQGETGLKDAFTPDTGWQPAEKLSGPKDLTEVKLN